VEATQRNAWLRQDVAALLRDCREEHYKASGPGGQRRNKVETAIRLVHLPSGARSHAEEARFLQENREKAALRLKKAIALHVRATFDLERPATPPEFQAYRTRQGGIAVNPKNPHYPLVLATVLDALHAAGGSYARTADALGVTTSQVLKFLRADTEAWRAVQEWLAARSRETTP